MTYAAPAGDCPLPEPGRGAPAIEHTNLLRQKKQPENYNYDKELRVKEIQRFNKNLKRLVQSGQITKEEASRFCE